MASTSTRQREPVYPHILALLTDTAPAAENRSGVVSAVTDARHRVPTAEGGRTHPADRRSREDDEMTDYTSEQLASHIFTGLPDDLLQHLEVHFKIYDAGYQALVAGIARHHRREQF
jgi:hypothetical protein